MAQALLSTSIPGLPEPRRGKVREVYDLGDQLLIVSTDRISAFDVIMQNGIPDKGKILNQMSAFWFDKYKEICPNHVIATEDQRIADKIGNVALFARHPELIGRCTLAKKAKPLAIECVARGYIAGSLYKDYRSQGRRIHGLNLPGELLESEILPEPIFTPATKAQEGHDENISFGQAADIVGREVAEKARALTLILYSFASQYAASKGLILADTKFEFGETDDGLIWIDEAFTPDSSRFWDAEKYKPGGPQASFDKQFVRDYLEATSWNKQPPGPELPDEIVEKTRDKYLQAYKRLTDRPLRL
jgi:phosphoribosylaminoimidazole-succinocarboxamide synthase